MNFSKLLGATMVAGAGTPPDDRVVTGRRGQEEHRRSRRHEPVAPMPKDRRRGGAVRRSGTTVAR